MNSDNELQALWQSEPLPPRVPKLLRRVQWHRRLWIGLRAFEAVATVFVVAHYVTYHGTAVGHLLFLPIVAVFFPALWILVFKNAAVARDSEKLGVVDYLRARVRQLEAALRELRFIMTSAWVLMIYAATCAWIIYLLEAELPWQIAVKQLAWQASLLFAGAVILTRWKRRTYAKEKALCETSIQQIDDKDA